MPDIVITQGKARLNLRISKQKGFIYRVLKKENITIEAGILVVENAAASSLGTTVSTPVEGDFTVGSDGALLKNKDKMNDQAIKWLVTDFHKAKVINAIELTTNEAPPKKIDFNLKIWGGTIFFPTFPVVKDNFAKNSSSLSIRFPEQKTEKVLIEFSGTDDNGNLETPKSVTLTNIKIKALSFPTNLSLRIGEQPPFFEYTGEFAPGVPMLLPDFSEEINTYLENNVSDEKEDQILIPLIVHSISDGKIILKSGDQNISDEENITKFGFDLQGILSSFYESDDAEESIQQTDLDFDGINERTIFLDLPEKASISEAFLQITGDLSEERLLFTNTADSSRFGALGSEDFLLAQRFQLDKERKISAIDLELEFLTEEAELSIAIHPDFNKQPSNTPLPDSIVEFQFPAPDQVENVGKSTLILTKFPSAISLKEGQYWIVLAVTQGQVTWRINDAQPNNRGGFFFTRPDIPINWIERTQPETNKSVSGVFRIHFLPEDTSDLISVRIGETAGNVPGIENPDDIDIEIQTLNVDGEERGVAELLKNALSETQIPLVFSTPSTGRLNITKLLVKFQEQSN